MNAELALNRHDRKAERWRELFSAPLVLAAAKQSFAMLRPDIQWRNPVMFVVEVGAALTLAYILRAIFGAGTGPFSLGYFIALDIWLWLTVLFANFATAFAEERGRAGAAALRRTRVSTPAHRLHAKSRQVPAWIGDRDALVPCNIFHSAGPVAREVVVEAVSDLAGGEIELRAVVV